MHRFVWCSALAVGLACGDSSGGSDTGLATGPCILGGACHPGLMCQDGICVASGGTQGTAEGGTDDDTSTTSSSTTDPATTDPATTDPATTDPATTDPSTTGACNHPDGIYGDCVNGMAPDACGGSGMCIVDDPMNEMNGVCFIEDCVDVCDCWDKEANDNSTSVVACGEIVDGGGNGCFLDCQDGKTCPTGMVCFASFICMWEAQP